MFPSPTHALEPSTDIFLSRSAISIFSLSRDECKTLLFNNILISLHDDMMHLSCIADRVRADWIKSINKRNAFPFNSHKGESSGWNRSDPKSRKLEKFMQNWNVIIIINLHSQARIIKRLFISIQLSCRSFISRTDRFASCCESRARLTFPPPPSQHNLSFRPGVDGLPTH